MGLRQQNKARIREALVQQALLLFSEHGVEKTTVHDIVKKVGIARGTFYNYFEDIDAIFQAVVHQMNQQIKTVLDTSRAHASSVYDYLYLSFKGYFDYVSHAEVKNFFITNQSYVRKSTYQSPILLALIKDLNRDLRNRKDLPSFTEKHEFLLLSIMLVGSPPELFLATQQSAMEFSNDQLAVFLAKTFHKVLQD
ncbi:MAG: TetR/AcrR family transcriptional regulator [Bacteroidetes bacterium]|nr:TetR/AcrR family transcriptional regulator [Bacteroidota bacterium]MDA0938014.1 TetR/AcrR family transcriptional regulator [Bacteroidota bacterium]MDA1343957.1 TetR/AcrR family transcriptional regulator [Bacteroidota bacterium]